MQGYRFNWFGKILLGFLLVSPITAQDRIKICAIRVEFQADENNLTTGDGRFVMDDTGVTPYTIDPPPHDRSYFSDQIIAVNNYYKAASLGKISVIGDVFPLGPTSAYQLPHPMGYYNPNTTDEENDYQLVQLFVDAIAQADLDPAIIFTDYDLVTIFHAGVGNDVNLGFDETPQDIPSLYFSPDFFKKSLGDTFGGIVVDDGSMLIDRGILLPETESQAGLDLALTGMFAANMGSFLGMHDLFSPSTKSAGIGRFGLMDSGLFNLFGLTPALPSAYTRELLEWESPLLLDKPQNDISLGMLNGNSASLPTLIRIPLNTDEYYLLEFRGDPAVNIDSLYAVMAEDRDTFPTYLEVLKTYFPDRIAMSDSTGVLLSVENYDWGLPGAGILIWHIDQSVIRATASTNRINDDRNNRGVDLEEADGSQDIGYEYTLVEPGFNSELGTWLDFWNKNNPAPLYKNEFSDGSSPNSKANRSYARSHISLSNFSSLGSSSMTFDYQRDLYENGFPLIYSYGNNIDCTNPLTAKIGPAGRKAIVFSDSNGEIFAISGKGEGFLSAGKFLVARVPGQETPHLALGDVDADGLFDRMVATTTAGIVTLYEFTDSDGDTLIDTVKTFQNDEKFSTGPVVQEPYFYIGTESGKILRFMLEDGLPDSTYFYADKVRAFTVVSPKNIATTFQSEDENFYPPVVVDLDGNGTYETVTFSTSTRILLSGLDGVVTYTLNEPAVGAPAFADIDDDGYFEIVVNTDSHIHAFNFNGSVADNFPIALILQKNEALVGTPIILDADGDQMPDILGVTNAGQIFAYKKSGQIIDGFPLTSGGQVINSMVATDLDDDGMMGLYALNRQGEVFGWRLNAAADHNSEWWTQASYQPGQNNFISIRLDAKPVNSAELMPVNTVYNYPNPNTQNYTTIRYFLREDARVNIKIFDLGGDIVAEFDGPGKGKLANETRWILDNVASGVYLGRIEAKSANDASVKIIKIMVVN